MGFFEVQPADRQRFNTDGYILVPQLFTTAEVDLLSRYARADQQIASRATSRTDAQGGTTTLSLSNDLEDNLYSAVVRSRRVAENMARLLDDEVYHYHHKMMLKEPRIGGAWEWHQDYGYWYDYGCLYPHMGSSFIAVDQATRENGCLQVLPGSQAMGRMNHMKVGGQTGADPERVQAAVERLPLVYVTMEPGDAIFFHGNLLHRSDQNTSPNPRWSLICCYNTRGNDPYKSSRHPNYNPLPLLDDADFLQLAHQHLNQLSAS